MGERAAARAGRPPARPRRVALPRARSRSSRRSSACSRPAGTRCSSTSASAAAIELLGTTIDDAAGEAFDKGARLLGLGYPGGAALDRLAADGDPEAFDFPVARVAGLDFSFSGVKTALLYAVKRPRRGRARATPRRPRRELPAGDRARPRRAGARRGGAARASTGSPSSAASPPTPSSGAALADAALAPLALCTDNAAMIASAGRYGSRRAAGLSRPGRVCRCVGSSSARCWSSRAVVAAAPSLASRRLGVEAAAPRRVPSRAGRASSGGPRGRRRARAADDRRPARAVPRRARSAGRRHGDRGAGAALDRRRPVRPAGRPRSSWTRRGSSSSRSSGSRAC